MPKKRDSHVEDQLNHHNGVASRLRDIILGGQDGVVNVLGLVLGVASATNDSKIVIIAGLASTFAESISMGAVAYTSSEAASSYYRSLEKQELHEIDKHPAEERAEIRSIFAKKGIRGTLLTKVVTAITSSRRRWLATMMAEELKVSPEHASPLNSAILVFFASLVGSLIPIIPFFMRLPVKTAMVAALAVCSVVLFLTGAYKAKITVGVWWRSGAAMMLIGIVSAVAGYLIGSILGVVL
ncbi:VIT1/CCC1 transporter family protein [Candidatus Woesearchaeota archaeon]|nr:VIT1/CCC1 transporter family protein [Candidatus Woesearchaeota archaeon]